MAKIVTSIGSGEIDRTSQLINDGENNTSRFVEQNELGDVAFSNDYNDLDNLPLIPPSYTDEQAQDAIGNILLDTSTIDLNYNDLTPNISASIKPNSITAIELANNINISEFINDSGYLNTSNFKTIEGQSLIGVGNIDLNKSDVGLSNVDNTSDLNKPISTATQTALNTKQATLVSGVNIRTINGNTLLGSTDLVIPIATDATILTKGILQLSGDLGGTAASPTTPTAIHKTGNESGLTGVKTWTNTGASQINGLNLVNNGTNTTGVISVTNQNSGYGMYIANNSGVGLRIENFSGTGISFSNSIGTGFALTNSSVGGEGFSIINSNTGIGIKINNTSTGIATIINSSVASTADLIQFTKNNILQTKFNQNGRYSINGGTSLEFLKADGSVDSSTYLTSGTGTPSTRTLNINGVSQDLSANREWRVAQADTGCLTFASPGITIAAPTQVNIGAVTGYIIDNETNPAQPTYTYINYPGESNKTVTTIGGGQGSYILLGVGNIITFQNTFPTSTQRKSKIWLGKVAHPNLTTLSVTVNEPDYITSPQSFARDLFQALGPYINEGVVPYANGANLTVNVTTGSVSGNGINFVINNTRANQITVSGSPITFLTRTQTGLGSGSFISIVDVGNYDVGGVVTAIPGANARSTNRYIYYVPSLGFIIQYGQEWYSNLSTAISAIGRESRIIYSTLPGNSILIGVLAARKDATQLNDLNQAQFFSANKLGDIGGSTSGISTGTRQSTYNNSTTPQTIVDDTLGADTWRNGRALDTSAIMQWQNIAGTTTASINGNGLITGNSFVKTGGVATEYLKADGSVSTLTNPITGTGTAGQVSFFNGTTTQVGDNGLFWNNTTKLLTATAIESNAINVNGFVRINQATQTNQLFGSGTAFAYGATPAQNVGIRNDSGAILFATGGLAADIRQIILPNGNTGFGAVNPTAKVQIDVNASTTAAIKLNSTVAGSGSGAIQFFENGVAKWNVTANANNDFIFYNQDGPATGQNFTIQKSTGNIGVGTNAPTNRFESNANSTTGGGYGIASLGAAGAARDILIAAQSGFSNGFTVQYNGTEMRYYFLNGKMAIGHNAPTEALHVVGNILASGSITPSDKRLKSNIVPIENGLDFVMKMKPISYDKAWELGGEVMSTEYGFIAQELKEIFPDEQIVKTPKEEDDILNVNYTSLIAVLTKAIQEQQYQIEELKNQINILNNK